MLAIHDAIKIFLLGAAVAVACLAVGCDQKETLLEVESPEGSVQVERETDTGEITVDVDE